MGSVWIGFVRSLRARAMQTYMVAPESISRLNLQLDETAAPDSTAVFWRACQLSACHSGLTSRCNLGRSAVIIQKMVRPSIKLRCFKKKNGELYVEAHHVMPVSKSKSDRFPASNVLTLCANHHREVHFGCVENFDQRQRV